MARIIAAFSATLLVPAVMWMSQCAAHCPAGIGAAPMVQPADGTDWNSTGVTAWRLPGGSESRSVARAHDCCCGAADGVAVVVMRMNGMAAVVLLVRRLDGLS